MKYLLPISLAIILAVAAGFAIHRQMERAKDARTMRLLEQERAAMRDKLNRGRDAAGNVTMGSEDRFAMMKASMDKVADGSSDEMKGMIQAVMAVMVGTKDAEVEFEKACEPFSDAKFYDIHAILDHDLIDARQQAFTGLRKAAERKRGCWNAIERRLGDAITAVPGDERQKAGFIKGVLTKLSPRKAMVLEHCNLHIQLCEAGSRYLQALRLNRERIAAKEAGVIAKEIVPIAEEIDALTGRIDVSTRKLVAAMLE